MPAVPVPVVDESVVDVVDVVVIVGGGVGEGVGDGVGAVMSEMAGCWRTLSNDGGNLMPNGAEWEFTVSGNTVSQCRLAVWRVPRNSKNTAPMFP